MRHSLYKYFDHLKWAEKFLEGEMLFRPLSYFRGCEDEARGDEYEGTSSYSPEEGLQITNHTQGTQFTIPWSFESSVKWHEILVFCASRRFGYDLAKEFNAVACVEVTKIRALCERVRAALPSTATFKASRVAYYAQSENPTPRWALPEIIATSKLERWAYQDEFRFVFSLTDALTFQNVNTQLVRRRAPIQTKPEEHLTHPLQVGSLRDICRLREVAYQSATTVS